MSRAPLFYIHGEGGLNIWNFRENFAAGDEELQKLFKLG
jgi:hypothetical protein